MLTCSAPYMNGTLAWLRSGAIGAHSLYMSEMISQPLGIAATYDRTVRRTSSPRSAKIHPYHRPRWAQPHSSLSGLTHDWEQTIPLPIHNPCELSPLVAHWHTVPYLITVETQGHTSLEWCNSEFQITNTYQPRVSYKLIRIHSITCVLASIFWAEQLHDNWLDSYFLL